MNKWTKNIFNEKYQATIISEFGFKIVDIDGKLYRIQLWDLAGQDKDATIAKIFAKDAHGCVVVADATIRSTLDDTITLKNAVDVSSKFLDGGKVPCVLVENKVDLLPKSQINNDKHLKTLAKQNGFIGSFRVSSKRGLNINESMIFLIRNIVKRMEKMSKGECHTDRGTAVIDTPNRATKKKENVYKCIIF